MKCPNPRQLAVCDFLVRSTCLLLSGASLSCVCRVPIPLSFGSISNSFSLGLLLEGSASWRMTEIWGSRLTCSCRADHGPLHPPDTGLDKFFQVLATAPHLASWAPLQISLAVLQLSSLVHHMLPCFFSLFPSVQKSLPWESCHCCWFVPMHLHFGACGGTIYFL